MKIDETVMLSINRVENSLIQKWRDYMTDVYCREHASYDDEVKMSNDDIRQIILKLGGLGNVVN